MSVTVPDLKHCGGCDRDLPLSAFNRHGSRPDGLQTQCRSCMNAKVSDWQRVNTRKMAVKRARFHARHPEVRKQEGMTWRARLRRDVLRAYGGRCECCGETREEFLTLDHINGRGEHVGLKSHQVYVRLRRAGFPRDNYRLLCWNCNCARGKYGECPHERERREEAAA